MNAGLVACWLLAGSALGCGTAGLALVMALRRSLGRYAPLGSETAPGPVLVIPATGRLDRLEDLRAALLAQRLRPARIDFAVEAADDPACARIVAAFGDDALPWSITIAGRAKHGAQKCRNQAAALRAHPPVGPVVLADADILPQRDWLAQLVRPLETGRADLVSGYRWPIPEDARFATLAGTWIDRAIAGLMKGAGPGLLWGGSLALTAEAIARLDLPAVLEAEITDDLAVARAARALGLRALVRGAVLVPTPFAHDWRSLVAFGRRQYQLVRFYVPGKWVTALALTGINFAGTGAAWLLTARSPWGLAMWAALALVALAGALERRRQARAAGIAVAWRPRERVLLLLALALPLVHLVHLAMILGALDGRTVRWGRWVYRLKRGRVTRIEPA